MSTWYPGHIQKAKRQIKEYLKKVDSVIIVLDARAPVATTNFETNIFKGKQKYFILNKSDLADENLTKKWFEFISKKFPVISCEKETKGSDIVKFILKNSRTRIPQILVAGVPNVGKSTIINKIIGRRKAQVGARPGITRGIQFVNVNDKLFVLDSPGVIFSEIFSKETVAKLLLIGSIPFENVQEFEIFDIAYSLYAKTSGLQLPFGEFLVDYGKKRGFLKKGGEVDTEKAKLSFFKEVSEGKFGKLTFEDEFDKFEEVFKDG